MLYILYDIILSESFMSFPVISWLVTVTVIMSSDVTDMWQYDHNISLTLTLDPKKEKKRKLNKKSSIQALHVWQCTFYKVNILLLYYITSPIPESSIIFSILYNSIICNCNRYHAFFCDLYNITSYSLSKSKIKKSKNQTNIKEKQKSRKKINKNQVYCSQLW